MRRVARAVPQPQKNTIAARLLRAVGLGKTTYRNEFDGAGTRRRLSAWQPTDQTINSIMAAQGELLRRRTRSAMRNNPYAAAAGDSFVGNLIGTGIKPSSLMKDRPELREDLMELWADWCLQCDADGVQDFYGMQSVVATALFEAGECFVRFRPRREEDGYVIPLQLQLLESEMCPFSLNRRADNGNYIMNGVEFDFRGKRVAYYFYQFHPGDQLIEPDSLPSEYVRVPAEEVMHVFKVKRPGQVRGVPLMTPALVRMFFLDTYDDAELERKKTAAMYAGFVTSPEPEGVIPGNINEDGTPAEDVDGAALATLEPGMMQQLLPGEDVKFSQPADVGGSYELFQYRQQLAIFAACGVPYTLASGDLKRANYSSLRGAIVEYRRKLEQLQFNSIVFQMCAPVWQRFVQLAVLTGALDVSARDFLQDRSIARARWIPPRYEWVDPLKDRQAEKLAVDAGFKSRSDVVEEEGYDPEENDRRIAADKAREKDLGLEFLVKQAAPTQPAAEDQAQEAADSAADDAAEEQAA